MISGLISCMETSSSSSLCFKKGKIETAYSELNENVIESDIFYLEIQINKAEYALADVFVIENLLQEVRVYATQYTKSFC